MRLFAVSGYSGTGKTTLVEALIQELTKRGYSVATVKSTKETLSDVEGSDTWRHRVAGAAATALLSPQAAVTWQYKLLGLKDVLRDWKYDFVLIEGMKDVDLPKFWCVRDISKDEMRSRNVKALITHPDSSIEWQNDEVEVLTSDDISILADIIEQEAAPI
ncbi:MAG: molybdopterin-guanine dinucleotide biosynthesis protein B [Candidatus Thorarchaeota archaeon]|nr:molybdopterin-guanine dinucleotide biosynthesis protein B [Candidatus Thorarchaeota archaeon]